MNIILDILDEIAPGANLSTNIAELGNDRKLKMRILEQGTVAARGLGIRPGSARGNRREGGAPNKESPKENNYSEEHIGRDYPHSFVGEVGIVCAGELQLVHLCGL